MIRLFLILCLLVPDIAYAQAKIDAKEITGQIPPIPHKGMLYSDDLQSSISYKCDYDEHLSCTFIEHFVEKPSEKDLQDRLADLKRMQPELNKGLDRECAPDYLKDTLAVIKQEIEPKTHEQKKMAYDVREMDAAEREQYAAMAAGLCETRDFESHMREVYKRETQKCKISSTALTLHFNASSQNELLWESTPLQDKECNATIVANLEAKKDQYGYTGDWTLTLKSTEANPSAAASKRCERAAGERIFSKRYDAKTRYHCEYLIFGAAE